MNEPDLYTNPHFFVYKKLEHFLNTNKIPNIIFHGSSGSGKKSILYNFLNKIYNNDKQKIKNNIMSVNCCYGKGIKFIRDELKYFSKMNISSGVIFKSIVLFNADCLTIDAQSALRRCIELFSHNTRFFIVVKNKQKLLHPILSRFCEIYIPEKKFRMYSQFTQKYDECNILLSKENTAIIKQTEQIKTDPENTVLPEQNFSDKNSILIERMNFILTFSLQIHSPIFCINYLIETCILFYENAISTLDILQIINTNLHFDEFKKNEILFYFHKIKCNYRCEKLLMFIILYKIITPTE
jgi:hypothetical protein